MPSQRDDIAHLVGNARFAHMNRISKCVAIHPVFENLMSLSPSMTVSSIDLAINNPILGYFILYKDTPAE